MKQIRVIQVGLGLIGGTVVEQIVANRSQWQSDFGLDVGVSAILTTAGALVTGTDGFSAEQLTAIVAARRTGSDLPAIGRTLGIKCVESVDFDLARLQLTTPYVLDAAAGSATSELGCQALAAGGGVVYSNKSPLSQPGSEQAAEQLWNGAKSGSVRYETTCGAGLPVISTIKSLLASGDDIISITGCLSGTLGAIFSDIADGKPLSRAIVAAKEAGYTEPDPRDDLSGLDVARKALILARTIGREVDLTDIASNHSCPNRWQIARSPHSWSALPIMTAQSPIDRRRPLALELR